MRRPRLLAVLASMVSAGALLAAQGGAQTATAALVRLPFPQDDGTLTPYTFELGYSLVMLTYDTLMWRDARGVPQPWLARDVEVSGDGRRVIVRLVEGVRWHDGRPFTSRDVEFTFEYIASRPHPRFSPQVRAIERVDAPDDQSVVFTLRHASPGFRDQPLADVPILPAHLWQEVGRGDLAPPGLPIGTGPYRMADYRPGVGYRFEANPEYFRGAPAVGVIEVSVLRDAEATVRALTSRRVDVVPASLPEDVADRVRGPGMRLVKGPSYVGTVVLFNLEHPPFERAEVRRALAAALDLEQMARTIGSAVAADRGYIHPASPWAPREILHHHDEAAARRAVAASDLGPVRLLAPATDPVRREAGRQVALAWRRIGVDAEVVAVTPSALSSAVGEDGSPPSFDVAVWSSPPLASYDPDFLAAVFGSDPATSPLNFMRYRSGSFDMIAATIASTTDFTGRRAAVGGALRLLARDAPVIPLFFSDGVFAYRRAAYDGWVYVTGSGIIDKRSFVEPAIVPAPISVPPQPTSGRDGSRLLVFAGLTAALGVAAVGVVWLVRRM